MGIHYIVAVSGDAEIGGQGATLGIKGEREQ